VSKAPREAAATERRKPSPAKAARLVTLSSIYARFQLHLCEGLMFVPPRLLLYALLLCSLMLPALSNHTVGVYNVTPYARLSYHTSLLHVSQLLHWQQEREG